MPTYDYECKSCEHTFELFQSINEPIKKKCPRCKRNSLRRLFGTGAALLFKGSGFYQTDYRSESYKKGAEAEKKASDGGSSKSSDSKPADSKAADSKPVDTKAADSRPVESRSDSSSRSVGRSGRKKLTSASA
jgi:putative FmdB family regulatory protein